MTSNKTKQQVLNLDCNHPKQQYRLEREWLERKRLGAGQQLDEYEPAVCQVAKKANGIMAWIRNSEASRMK